jgi:aldehyde:ferredoxin oxidoreductase
MYGYVGKMLRVNLTTGECSIFSGEQYYKDYLGGKGLAARLYWEEVGPEVKPFDPENKLFFTSGPMNGTGAGQGSKGCVGGKSPIWYPVSTFSHSTTGNFGVALKRAGFDAIIVEGKADHAVYLWIYNGRVEIRDAYDLWGKSTTRAREVLRDKHGRRVTVATIGPAGENLVVSGSIHVASNQVFGRGGFGAVMGSKNLKALVLHGNTRINVAEPEKLLEITRDRAKFFSIKVGEKRIVDGKEIVGKPWGETDAFNFGRVGGGNTQLKDMAKQGQVRIKPNACEACYVFCRTKFHFEDESERGATVICASNIGWSTAENIANQGSKKMLGKDSYNFAQKVDDTGINVNDLTILAPMYGQKTPFDENEHIEGSIMGGDWIYQAFLLGILNDENTGLPWDKFGTREFNDEFLMQLTYRYGFGDILANGFRYATQYIMEHEEFGPDRDKILFVYKRIHGKAGNMGCIESGHGQYVPNPGRAIYTALNDRTGSEPEFQWSRMTMVPQDGGTPKEVMDKWIDDGDKKIYDLHYWGKEVAHAVVKHEEYSNILDSMVCCAVGNFSGSVGFSYYTGRPVTATRNDTDWVDYTPHGAPEYMSAITGEEYSIEHFNEIGDRISQLVRAIWVRDGYTTVDHPLWGKDVDTLWELHFERKDRQGVNYTDKAGFESARSDYYAERGWVDGVPTRATLERFGLGDVADDLEKRNLLPG